MYPEWDTLDVYTVNALSSYAVHGLLRVLETFKFRTTVKQVCNLNCQGDLDGEDLTLILPKITSSTPPSVM